MVIYHPEPFVWGVLYIIKDI